MGVHWSRRGGAHLPVHTRPACRQECVHAHAHSHTHSHMHTRTRTHMHTRTLTCTRSHVHTHTYAHKHTRTLACTHTCSHIHSHACSYAHTHTHTLTCMLTCTHSQTHTLTCMLTCSHTCSHTCTHGKTRAQRMRKPWSLEESQEPPQLVRWPVPAHLPSLQGTARPAGPHQATRSPGAQGQPGGGCFPNCPTCRSPAEETASGFGLQMTGSTVEDSSASNYYFEKGEKNAEGEMVPTQIICS